MKTLLTMLMILLLVPVTATFAQEEPVAENLLFVGGVLDEGNEYTLALGVGAPVAGRLWSFSYTNVGEYGSLSTELAFMLNKSGSGFYIGPIAGPGVDWTSENDLPAVAYIVGAGGLVLGYDINPNVGIWGYGKYKFHLDGDDVLYQDGGSIGAGIYKRF